MKKILIQEDLRRRNIRQDRRETVEAEWGSALRELESVGYLERVDAPPTAYTVQGHRRRI